MNSRTTGAFRDRLDALPAEARRQAREAYLQFRDNPQHPGLRFKKVHPRLPIYSARVGIAHRAVGVIDGDTIIWFWIGPHHEYDKLLRSL